LTVAPPGGESWRPVPLETDRMLQFCLFDTAIGPCALVCRDGRIVGAQLPEPDDEAARLRLARRFPQACEALPPAFIKAAIS
jgi:methylated-DNA-[protein]-cysteine S-methyltransferase